MICRHCLANTTGAARAELQARLLPAASPIPTEPRCCSHKDELDNPSSRQELWWFVEKPSSAIGQPIYHTGPSPLSFISSLFIAILSRSPSWHFSPSLKLCCSVDCLKNWENGNITSFKAHKCRSPCMGRDAENAVFLACCQQGHEHLCQASQARQQQEAAGDLLLHSLGVKGGFRRASETPRTRYAGLPKVIQCSLLVNTAGSLVCKAKDNWKFAFRSFPRNWSTAPLAPKVTCSA